MSNIATATINVVNFDIPPVAADSAGGEHGTRRLPGIKGTLLPGTDLDGPTSTETALRY